MAISFRNIPANLRVPLAYFEFDPTMAGRSTSIQNALILCTRPDAAPPAPATLSSGTFAVGAQAALITALQATTDGAFAVAINGTATNTGEIDFSAIATLPQAAVLIQTALGAAVTVAWTVNQFIITTVATGVAATIGFAFAPASGTDISALLQLTATTGAAVQQGTAGTAASLLPIGTPTLIISADQARRLTGPGSALGRQCQRWFQNNRGTPLYALAAAETGFTAAAGSIAWGGPATESGTIPLYIGGRSVRVIVNAQDTAAEIAQSVADAINAIPTLGVTATANVATPETTNIIAAQAGALGALRIDIALAGPTGGEIMPGGVTATITQMVGGIGAPDVADMLAGIGDAPVDFVVCPWATGVDLNALDDFFNDTTGRWSWAQQLYGHGFCSSQGTIGQLSALGNTRNGQHVTIFGFNNSPAPADEWLAAYVAQASGSLIVDPARPVQGLPLQGIIAPPREDRFTIIERQVLYFDGIASYYAADDGTVYIDRLITTYRENVWGAPDDSYLDVETMYTAAHFARFMRNRILLKFPRHKLANDGTRFGVGQAIVTPSIIRAEMIASYGELETSGLVEDADGFEDALIVERNANDPNRVDVLLPPNFINQLRIFAALVQFRL